MKKGKKASGKKSALLPIFRSESQASILATLILNEREYTMTELVQITGVSRANVDREIDRLLESTMVTTRTQGRNRLAKISIKEPLKSIIYQLMLYTYGPLEILSQHFHQVEGISEIYIYGSWAARYKNIVGAEPNDIDLLIVGNPDLLEINEIADAASKILKKEVNPHVVRVEAWANPQGDFLKGLKDHPLVPINIKE